MGQTHNNRALGFAFEVGELDEFISAIDPEETGVVSYETFLEACSLKIKGACSPAL